MSGKPPPLVGINRDLVLNGKGNLQPLHLGRRGVVLVTASSGKEVP